MSLATPWRLLVMDALDGADNMALDSALHAAMERQLLEGKSPPPVLRLYAWEPPAVSTGRNQPLEQACALEECAALGIDVVQRPTGGRGVLHEAEVTFAVVAPAAGPFAGPGVTRASAAIAQALLGGLRRLGVDASIEAHGAAPRVPRRPAGVAASDACFAAAARSEVVAGGRKLCGSAQRRGRAAILQHGSLPLVFDVERQARALGADPILLGAKAIGLAECLARRPEVPEVHEALVSAFAEEFGVLQPSGLTDEEGTSMDELGAALRADPSRWRSARRAVETPCPA